MHVADDLLKRLLAALPDLRSEYEKKRREIAAEGLGGSAPELFISERTIEVRGSSDRSTPPDRAELKRWLDFFEQEWGRDSDLDVFIDGAVLVYLPDRARDQHSLRELLGPRLAAVVNSERDYRAYPAEDAFLADLRQRFPELEIYAQDNTYGDHDALLSHPFLGDVVHRIVQLHRGDDPAGHARAQAIINAVADALGDDPTVDDLIATGFVENLPDPDRPGADIVRRLPPALAAIQRIVRGDLTPLREETASDE